MGNVLLFSLIFFSLSFSFSLLIRMNIKCFRAVTQLVSFWDCSKLNLYIACEHIASNSSTSTLFAQFRVKWLKYTSSHGFKCQIQQKLHLAHSAHKRRAEWHVVTLDITYTSWCWIKQWIWYQNVSKRIQSSRLESTTTAFSAFPTTHTQPICCKT